MKKKLIMASVLLCIITVSIWGISESKKNIKTKTDPKIEDSVIDTENIFNIEIGKTKGEYIPNFTDNTHPDGVNSFSPKVTRTKEDILVQLVKELDVELNDIAQEVTVSARKGMITVEILPYKGFVNDMVRLSDYEAKNGGEKYSNFVNVFMQLTNYNRSVFTKAGYYVNSNIIIKYDRDKDKVLFEFWNGIIAKDNLLHETVD